MGRDKKEITNGKEKSKGESEMWKGNSGGEEEAKRVIEENISRSLWPNRWGGFAKKMNVTGKGCDRRT